MVLKVVYIAGYGRSGSTVLDVALGQAPGVFGAGEISAMCRHVWQANEYCACGQRIRSCAVWGRIMVDWTAADVAEYRKLQLRIEPLSSLRRRFSHSDLTNYVSRSVELLNAVAKVTGVSVIVDSSKAPGRALALATAPGIDLRVLHLVRDARGVANAMARSIPLDLKGGVQKPIRPRSPYRTALRWRMYNAYAEKLEHKIDPGRFLRVRYEDFAFDPARELGRIGRCIGEDLSGIISIAQNGQAFRPRHQMAGSRIRMRPDLTVKLDQKWQSDMAPQAQKKVLLVASAQLGRYGYLA